jgi:anti-sigma regulatory factor (Ser/Thr protein kinase)
MVRRGGRMLEALPSPLRLVCPTDHSYVRPVRKMVEALLVAQGCDEEKVEDAGLVLTEMLQNAIEHGSRADGTEDVAVVCRVEAQSVHLEVVDPGTGKDPREVLRRDVTRPPPPEAARGRGLFLIHRMSCDMERDLSGDGGCRLAVRLPLDEGP